jgi:biopolymer transport protein TolR
MRSSRARKFKAEINVVPYVDVMLVLLVIFMAVAPISIPSIINLPQAAKSSTPPTDYIEAILSTDNTTSLKIHSQNQSKDEANSLSHPELLKQLARLHQTSPEMPLMISADKDIVYDRVIQIISEAKKLGITRVGLATKE